MYLTTLVVDIKYNISCCFLLYDDNKSCRDSGLTGAAHDLPYQPSFQDLFFRTAAAAGAEIRQIRGCFQPPPDQGGGMGW